MGSPSAAEAEVYPFSIPRLKPRVYPRAIAKLHYYRKLSSGLWLLFSIVPVFQRNPK